MFAASMVSLFILGVGIYGYFTKSFKRGDLYAVLTDGQALGVLIFCGVMAVGILVYAWNVSE